MSKCFGRRQKASACVNAAQFTLATECEHGGKVGLMTEEGGGTLVTLQKENSRATFFLRPQKQPEQLLTAEICKRLCFSCTFHLPPSVNGGNGGQHGGGGRLSPAERALLLPPPTLPGASSCADPLKGDIDQCQACKEKACIPVRVAASHGNVSIQRKWLVAACCAPPPAWEASIC